MSRLTGIQFDKEEFIKMAKGRIRKDMSKYLRRGTVPIQIRGGKIVSISMDWFEVPSWRYGFPETGVGQGEGEPGEDLGPVESDDDGEHGPSPGGHGGGGLTVDIDVTLEELTEFFQETLELPRIKPKGDRSIKEAKEKFNTVSRVGPLSRIHDTRTFEEALQRAIAEGTFNPPEKTIVVPERSDFRFKSYSVVTEPKNNAVILYIRDISGSMGLEETMAARYLCGLCSFWLAQNYDGLEEAYVVHHGEGWEVAKEEFFSIRSSGGTDASSGHEKAYEIIDSRFSPSKWNIYIVYLSDGMNFESDNEPYRKALREKLLPICNQYNYGQIDAHRGWWGAYGGSGASMFSAPGTIGQILEREFRDVENIAIAEIIAEPNDYSSVIEAIKIFFKKGN